MRIFLLRIKKNLNESVFSEKIIPFDISKSAVVKILNFNHLKLNKNIFSRC